MRIRTGNKSGGRHSLIQLVTLSNHQYQFGSAGPAHR